MNFELMIAAAVVILVAVWKLTRKPRKTRNWNGDRPIGYGGGPIDGAYQDDPGWDPNNHDPWYRG